jgi:hypothetical protein
MRRTYISPEYDNNLVNGSFNILEQSSFFASKMLEIEDQITIKNDDIIWYQKSNKEQLDFSIESSLESKFYSPSNSKRKNHTLKLDEKQSDFQKQRNAMWVLEIDVSSILQSYIFASMKKYRTFEGLKNEMTIYNDVEVYLNEYIKNNVMNKYRLSNVEIFIDYKELVSNNSLKFNNIWNPLIDSNSILEKFQLNQIVPESIVSINFNQISSSQFYFEYYFNLLFEKI